MRWFDAVAHVLSSTLHRLQEWSRAGRRMGGPRIRYMRVEEFPDRLKPATLYVAGEEPYPWAAAMQCPCGCGDVIELNLLEQARPHWRIRQNRDGTVTLMPSVWRTKGCRSHFLLRNSRIDWCRVDFDSSGGRIR